MFTNCGDKVIRVIDGKIIDNEYDNHPPISNITPQVKEIQSSLALLNCTAYYTQYNFAFSDEVWKEDLTDPATLKKADVKNINRSSAGTGMVLAIRNKKILLLTCNHVIDYPSEVYEHYSKFYGDNYVNIYLKKKKQTQFISYKDNIIDMEVIATDSRNDMVLLSGKSNIENIELGRPNIKLGNSRDLRTGNFIYVFGFPKGHKMVSSGIVSMDDKREDVFLIDTPFNRGMSGGIVYAIRDDSPNFELVGMATSSAANFEFILKPNEDVINKKMYNKSLPYEGSIYIEEKARIRYGITYVNNIDLILDFLRRNKEKIEAAGFKIDSLIKSRDE